MEVAVPPLVGWFTEKTVAKVLYDGLQSEEGSRYYGKYNRNVVLEIPSDYPLDLPINFRWFNLETLCKMVVSSNVFNTYARSVLACMDWDTLQQGKTPFQTQDTTSFGHKLHTSYIDKDNDSAVANIGVFHWLSKLRTFASVRQQVMPLDQVRGWSVTDSTIEETVSHFGFTVKQFAVTAHGREVYSWDQPLIDSHGIGMVVLFCQMHGNLLKFLVKADYELGYLEGLQLSTTISVSPGEQLDKEDVVQAKPYEILTTGACCRVEIQCKQSEEGGVFFRIKTSIRC